MSITMTRSQIFDNFIKISQEKGLIANDSSEAKKKLEETKRADSLDAKAISQLYGVKNPAPKDMEYQQNIIEIAHKKPVIIGPSYDKLNALVENNQERQNILLRIVNKTPDGLSTQRKYAEQELTLTLVQLANNFDNTDQDKLRKLADSCLLKLSSQQTKKSLQKKAAILIPIAIAAATIGAIYAHQHIADADEGLEENYKNLVKQLDDFLDDNNSGLGITGHEYSQEMLSDIREFKDRLADFMQLYRSLNEVIRELEKPRDAKELMELSKQPKTHTVINAVKKLRELATNMSTFMDIIYKNFSSSMYKNRHTKSKGVVDKLLETSILGVSLKGGQTGLIADDFQDVINAMNTFRTSIAELLKVMEAAGSIEEDSLDKLSASLDKAKEDFGSPLDLSGPPKLLSTD